MKTLLIIIFLLLVILIGGLITLSFMDMSIEQHQVKEEIHLENL